MATEEQKYPIGKYQKPDVFTDEIIRQFINEIEIFPEKIKQAVTGLTEDQLDTPYRPEGWTIRQVVNHCADSHMNSLVRFKLTLTEDKPTINPYDQARWADLADSKKMPVGPALKMLEGIHERWVVLLKSLDRDQINKSYIHPEYNREIRLDETIGLYAWHCRHHLAHIVNLKKSKNW
jgi:hypothetical protein